MNGQDLALTKKLIDKYGGGTVSDSQLNSAIDKKIADGTIASGEQLDSIAIQVPLPNGVDDTKIINDCIQKAKNNNIRKVIIPAGTYNIDCTNFIESPNGQGALYEGGILLEDNIHLELHENTILKAIPNNVQGYNLISCFRKNNCSITGGTIIGERNEHIGTTGEWGYGISLRNAKNITVSNIYIRDFWGDGINVQQYGASGDYICENIKINNIICDNNRRQGMSIEGVKFMYVTNSRFINTQGASPSAGIDIEPYTEGKVVCDYIYIDNCYFNNNATGLSSMLDSTNNVFVTNCVFENTRGSYSLSLNNGAGYLEVVNCKFDKGFYFYNHDNIIDKSIIKVSSCNIGGATLLQNIKSGTISNSFFNSPEYSVLEVVKGGEFNFYNNIVVGKKNDTTGNYPQYLIGTNAKNTNIYNNLIKCAKSVNFKGDNLMVNNNVFELLTQSSCFESLTRGSLLNNSFRACGYGSEIFVTDYVNNTIIGNNIIDKFITEEEEENGFISSNTPFIRFSGVGEGKYNNISFIWNVANYNLLLYKTRPDNKEIVENAIIKNI